MVPKPSGKAKVCNTSIPGSNPGGTSVNSGIRYSGVCFLYYISAEILKDNVFAKHYTIQEIKNL